MGCAARSKETRPAGGWDSRATALSEVSAAPRIGRPEQFLRKEVLRQEREGLPPAPSPETRPSR